MSGVQLSLDGGLDPRELAKLSAIERGKLYRRLALCPLQREACEQAVRLVIAKRYGRRR